MTDIPQDAPRSEDGQWWWDGSQWQAVPAGAAAPAPGAAASSDPAQTPATPASGQLSDDGQWQWDGSQWQPAQGAQPAATTSGGRIEASDFPTLAALSHADPHNFDSYLQSIGIDPKIFEEAVS
jgi:hypothetical protein